MNSTAVDHLDESPVLTSSLEPIQTLGKGTFGKVVLARRSYSDVYNGKLNSELVAVKIIAKNRIQQASQVERTEAELKVLTEVAPKSAYLVPCHYAYQTEDLLLCVMEYSGRDLRKLLNSREKFSEVVVANIGIQILEGVRHLHENGVLYRDLKPDNILLSAKGTIKLADFGLSKFLVLKKRGMFGCLPNFSALRSKESLYERARTACGTPMYQSPELVMHRPYLFEADWWAFGNVIFELLTGRPPFFAETVNDVHENILYKSVNFPDGISQKARSLITRLLRKPRSRRLGLSQSSADDIRNQPFFMTQSYCSMYNDNSTHSSLVDEDLDSISDTDYVPDHIAPNKSPLHVPGFQEMPNDAFARLVSTDSSSDLSRMSSCSILALG